MPIPSIPTPAPLPPPPPAVGAIGGTTTVGGLPTAPLNIGMGSAAAVGSAALTTSQLGVEVTEVSYGINLAFQFLKNFRFVDQHRWWPLILILLGVGAFMVLAQGDYITAALKGFAAAFQAALTYHSFKIGGVNLLPSAPDNPPSGG